MLHSNVLAEAAVCSTQKQHRASTQKTCHVHIMPVLPLGLTPNKYDLDSDCMLPCTAQLQWQRGVSIWLQQNSQHLYLNETVQATTDMEHNSGL